MAKRSWSIQQNLNNKKWYLVFSAPLECGSFEDASEIYAECKAKGLDKRSLVSCGKIQNFVCGYLGNYQTPPPFLLQLEPSFDAKIIVSQDKLNAKLYVRKAFNPSEKLPLNIVLKVLQNSKIKDLNMPDINAVLSHFEKSEEMELEEPIKTGIFPKRGADRKLIPHFESVPRNEIERLIERFKNPKFESKDCEDPCNDETFPISEAESLVFVKKDEVIYEISPPEPGEAGEDVYGNTIQGLPGNVPFVLDLRNISQIQHEFKADVSGLLLAADSPRGLKLRIIPYKDAKAKAVVSRDKMEAVLILSRGSGAGEPLTVPVVQKALNDAGLLDVVSEEKIEQAISTAAKTDEETEIPILTGTEPIAPGSYLLEWKIDFSNGKNSADVQKDNLILVAQKLSKGKEGKDVFGKAIKPLAAHEVFLPKTGENIRSEDAENETRFFADKDGELTFEDNTLQIICSKTIKDNIEKGCIFFPGDLVITGEIGSEVRIKAKGSLTVTGDIPVCLLYSEASLKIKGGMKGKGRGTVWSKKNAELTYLEGSKIFSGGDIKIDDYCFMCEVKTNGLLSVCGYPGVLAGGNIHAAKGVIVRTLGAQKNMRTILSFGQNYLLKDEIEVHEKEVERNTSVLKTIDEELKTIKDPSFVEKLRHKKVQLIKRNSALGIRIFNLKENFETHIPSSIKVIETVYPGVVLESHGRYLEILEPQNNVEFIFDKEKGHIISKTEHK